MLDKLGLGVGHKALNRQHYEGHEEAYKLYARRDTSVYVSQAMTAYEICANTLSLFAHQVGSGEGYYKKKARLLILKRRGRKRLEAKGACQFSEAMRNVYREQR